MSTLHNTTLSFSFQGENYQIEIDKIDTTDTELDYWYAFTDSKGEVFNINIWFCNNGFFEIPLRFSILKDYKVKKGDDLKVLN
jgi:hypothetical protein